MALCGMLSKYMCMVCEMLSKYMCMVCETLSECMCAVEAQLVGSGIRR